MKIDWHGKERMVRRSGRMGRAREGSRCSKSTGKVVCMSGVCLASHSCIHDAWWKRKTKVHIDGSSCRVGFLEPMKPINLDHTCGLLHIRRH